MDFGLEFNFPFGSVFLSERCPYYLNPTRSGQYKDQMNNTQPIGQILPDLFSWACIVILFVLFFNLTSNDF